MHNSRVDVAWMNDCFNTKTLLISEIDKNKQLCFTETIATVRLL